jgi:putative DNA methylase
VTDPGLLTAGTQRFYLRQGSSVSTPLAAGSVDAVVTDPPYYDSIQYTDLAAYFRVWLRRMVPDAADWDYDAADSAVDPERRGQGSRYVELLAGIFEECRRVLRPEGRLVFTFHHWKPEAWTALTWALYRGGFGLVNRYVVHAEHPISVHINNMHALTHDAILVCAPREVVTTIWAEPAGLTGLHSRDFSQGCADALGWMLGQPGLDEVEVARRWKTLLAG